MAQKINPYKSLFLPFVENYVFIVARISFFIMYFWFGILKIIGTSAANPLVASLQEKTLPFLTFEQFIIIFSLYEMAIGILFLFPKVTRISYILFILHLGMTIMPLIFLPALTWQAPFTPTLEAQYIIKNLTLLALASILLLRYEKRGS